MVKGSSSMDKQNTGDASNSKGTVKMTVLQHLMEKEAELKKELMEKEAELKKEQEATKLRGEELKSWEKNFGPIHVRMMNGDFEGIGLEELKIYHDMFVETKSMIDAQLN